MSKAQLCILIAMMALSACTWPGYGEGGMDDVFTYERTKTVDPELSERHERSHQLAKALDRLRNQIDAAWQGQEGRHRPAGMTMVENQWNRAAREWAGDMLDDAEFNLSILATRFRALRDELRQSLMKANRYQPASI